MAETLKLIGINKQYGTPAGAQPVRVLNDVSFEVGPGDSVAIVGPSGSGKSTLLHIIGTLDKPTAGAVWLDGVELGQLSEADLATMRSQRIGFIFQSHYLLPQCTALENVLVPTLANSRTNRPAAAERARHLLQRVGLGERLSHRPAQLSGGECQRLAVVRALINQPRLLLADEPTGALDRASAEQLTQLLAELNREENVTLIVVTHSFDLARRMKRVYELRDGRLVAQ